MQSQARPTAAPPRVISIDSLGFLIFALYQSKTIGPKINIVRLNIKDELDRIGPAHANKNVHAFEDSERCNIQLATKQGVEMSLQGKTVLITGGANGIGAATAELFAAEGARVIVTDVAVAAGAALVERLGPKHRFVRLDVSDQDEWRARLPEIAPNGKLDSVIFNAGVMTRPPGEPGLNNPMPWMTPPRLSRLIGVNLYGVIWGILACFPLLVKTKGTMLVTSSAGGLQPVPFDPCYAMTKYGLIGLASSLAPTLMEAGVRMVTICPHSVDTDMQPPDLQARKHAAGYASPPSHMAMSTLHIHANGKSGEIWLSRPDGLPFPIPAPAPFTATD